MSDTGQSLPHQSIRPGHGVPVEPVRSQNGVPYRVHAPSTTANQSVRGLPRNPNRRGATVVNDAASTVLYVLLSNDGTAQSNNYSYKLTGGATLETPFDYTGEIHLAWGSGVAVTDFAMITEFR